MSESITPPVIATPCSPAETPDTSICATLYVHNISPQRYLFVFGVKGKYEFKWSEQHKKLVREYTSPAQFQKDEQDIRLNIRNQYCICVLTGSPHPVTYAREALEALIAAGRSIGSPERRAALAAIVATAEAAIAVIDAPPVDEETAAPPVAVPPEQAPASSVDANNWKDTATGVPLEPPVVAKEGDVTVPINLHRRHNQAELMQGGIEAVREVAKKLGISLMRDGERAGPKARGELVADILAAEQQKAA